MLLLSKSSSRGLGDYYLVCMEVDVYIKSCSFWRYWTAPSSFLAWKDCNRWLLLGSDETATRDCLMSGMAGIGKLLEQAAM